MIENIEEFDEKIVNKIINGLKPKSLLFIQ